MKLKDAQSIQDSVAQLVAVLNTALREGTEGGLRFELHCIDSQQIQMPHPVPVIDVLVFVDPRNIDQE